MAEDVIATVDVPSFSRAAMDGYAVVAADTFGASMTNPAILSLVGEVKMGRKSEFDLKRGTAITIPTGGPIPEGADAVVMLEYTKHVGTDKIEVYSAVPAGENVSRAGEDVKKGDLVLRKGARLKPQDLGILVSIGASEVMVVKRPFVAVLSTGNELVEPGNQPRPGQIIDANRIIISSLVRELGGVPVDLGIARDSEDEIRAKLKEGLSKADLVLVSGGTSVGALDLVPLVINSLGKPGVVVHGVSMRPAYPTGLACIEGKPIVLLSGYPVAAMIGFDTFVKPLLSRLMRTPEEPTVMVKAKLSRRIPSPGGMRTFVRVLVKKRNGEFIVEPIRMGGSGVITTMIKANGMIVIPESVDGFEVGEIVDVSLFRPVEGE